MQIDVKLTGKAIMPPLATADGAGDCGAVVEFTGTVRGQENGQAIAALEYEAYATMALSEMRRLIEELAERHPCHAVWVVHRIGVVPVGEAAIYIKVTARHRAEAFALMTGFMDRLKQDVPIWKRRALAPGEAAEAKSS